MADITFTPPGEIDGHPADVARDSTQQLAEASLAVADLIEQTVKQVENAGRQEALEAGADAEDGGLDEWWRENRPTQAARAELLRAFSERLPEASRALDYAVSRGE